MSKKAAAKKMPTKQEIVASKGLSAHAKEVLLNSLKNPLSKKVVVAPSARSAASSGETEVNYDDEQDGAGGSRSPNDDRSDSMNPNNPAYQASVDNRSDQLNPNNPAYHSSRGGGKGH